MAEFYQGLVCKSKKVIGEQIARFEVSQLFVFQILFNVVFFFFFLIIEIVLIFFIQHAVELFKAAQQRSNKPSLFQEYANRAQRNFNEVKKDNDFIYHERIPDVTTLEPVGKANVAKLLPLAHPMSANFKGLYNVRA